MNVSSTHTRAGRGFWRAIKDGTIILKSEGKINEHSKRMDDSTTFEIENGDIVSEFRTWTDKDGNHKVHTIYGKEEKEWINGKLIDHTRFKPGSNRAKIFKGEWKKTSCKLNGKYDIKVSRLCYGGSFRREIAKYPNGKIAFKVGAGMKHAEVYYPDGKLWLKLLVTSGKLNFSYKETLFTQQVGEDGDIVRSWRSGGTPEMPKWDYLPLVHGGSYEVEVYDRDGKIKTKGKCVNRQKQEIWIEDYKEVHYLSGVAVDKKLYFAKPEELHAEDILNLDNAQLRTSLMNKVGAERILKESKAELIHQDGDYELYKIPIKQAKDETRHWVRGDTHLNLLKVRCPSTGTYYVLKVPPDTTTCEQARKWTLGIREDEQIEFVAET